MIIGLTGGIGSGKTTVAHLFETLGCVIYNSDERAKDLYFNVEIKKQVIALLGKEAYTNDLKINKVYISQAVFSDKNILKQLNAIIHPAVKNDFKLFADSYPQETLIIKESALLFEENLYQQCRKTVLVISPLDLKIDRVMKRNAISKLDVEKRMLSQWTDEQKIPLADFIIINDDKKALIPQVLNIISQLKINA